MNPSLNELSEMNSFECKVDVFMESLFFMSIYNNKYLQGHHSTYFNFAFEPFQENKMEEAEPRLGRQLWNSPLSPWWSLPLPLPLPLSIVSFGSRILRSGSCCGPGKD